MVVNKIRLTNYVLSQDILLSSSAERGSPAFMPGCFRITTFFH